MNGVKPMAMPWGNVPFVYVTIPTCPSCGSPKYHRVRTENGGDGSFAKKVVCKVCDERYKIILELPEAGSGE